MSLNAYSARATNRHSFSFGVERTSFSWGETMLPVQQVLLSKGMSNLGIQQLLNSQPLTTAMDRQILAVMFGASHS